MSPFTVDTPTTPPQTSLGTWVAQQLRSRITTGELAPGEHLREVEIATALGTSRGPVREGFAILEAEGQVEIRRHRGAFVSVLTRRDVEEVHTLRAAVEALAAERATQRMTPALLAELDGVLAEMEAAGSTVPPEVATALDLRFHTIVYEAADHARLLRVWTSLRSQVAFFLHTRNAAFPDFVTVGHREHRDLRDALASGDVATARAAAEKHMTGAYLRLTRLDLPD